MPVDLGWAKEISGLQDYPQDYSKMVIPKKLAGSFSRNLQLEYHQEIHIKIIFKEFVTKSSQESRIKIILKEFAQDHHKEICNRIIPKNSDQDPKNLQ